MKTSLYEIVSDAVEKNSFFKKLLKEEYFLAMKNLQRAWDNFNMVDEEYFEIANMEVTIAQMKLDLIKQKLLKL